MSRVNSNNSFSVSREMKDPRRLVFSSGERQNPFKAAADHNNPRGIHTLDTMEKSNMSKKGPGNSARRKDENVEKPVSKIQVNSKCIDFINATRHHFPFSF